MNNQQFPNRRSIRLRNYDYSKPGSYFVTICTNDHECLFGVIDNKRMNMNELGNTVLSIWCSLPEHYPSLKTDSFVIMPNHVHGILNLCAPSSRLSEIIRAFKSFSSREINEITGSVGRPLWQRSYYEHVIRNEDDLYQIRQYVLNNPLKWALDRENPRNRAGLRPAPTDM